MSPGISPRADVLGSLSYDGLLQLDLPPGVSVVGCADHVAASATARNASLVEDALNTPPALELVEG